MTIKFKSSKGYSLIELLVTMAIMLIVLSAVYLTYISILKGYKKESATGSKIVEEQSGLEIVRKDISLAGLGLPSDISPVSISGAGDNITLNLYSTQNPSNNKTLGYLVLKYDNSSNDWSIVYDKREDTTNNNIVVVDGNRKFWVSGIINYGKIPQDNATKPQSNNYISFGFPYDVSNYQTISYKISGTPVERCNPTTKNLTRNNIPIINCVKGFKIFFGVDSNGDGSADIYLEDMTNNYLDNATKIYNNLNTITLYILTHDGGIDRSFNYTSDNITFTDSEIGKTVSFSLLGVQDYRYYRWKILKISGKTINVRSTITY